MTSVVKEGYLQKYSTGIFKGWKKRYFKLHTDGQFVFYDFKDGPRGGNINLATECQDIQVGAGIMAKIPKLPDHKETDCIFLFVAKDKRFLLLADNRRELDSWLQALNNARPIQKSSYSVQNSGYPQQARGYPNPPQGHSLPVQSQTANHNQYPGAPPPYSQAPPPTQPGMGTLGFEGLAVGSSHPPYPPNQGGAYPPQQGALYPPTHGVPYSQHPSGAYPPHSGYPQHQQYPHAGSAAPAPYPQQAGAVGQYPPPPDNYPPGPHQPQYGAGYSNYPQGGYYPQAQGGYYPQQQSHGHKQKSKGGLGGLGALLGGGGAAAAGGGGMLKKAGKHKKLIGGAAAAALGGYAIHKATKRFSWSSGSWSSGSFGSFGSFGS